MDADDHELIRIFVGEVVKVLDDTQAVHRAIGIEVEKDDPAFCALSLTGLSTLNQCNWSDPSGR